MAGGVNWGLAPQPFDYAQTLQFFAAGRDAKLQQAQQARQERQFQRQEQAYQRDEQKRTALAGAINPATGAIDRNAARGAFLGAGDAQGAIDFDQSIAKASREQVETALKMTQAGMQLLGAATDPQSYAAARAQAAQLGLDVNGIPEQFDPAWVQRTAMQSLDTEKRLTIALRQKEAEAQQRDREEDNRRDDRRLSITERATNERVALAREANSRARVRHGERALDRAAFATGRVSADLSDLDY